MIEREKISAGREEFIIIDPIPPITLGVGQKQTLNTSIRIGLLVDQDKMFIALEATKGSELVMPAKLEFKETVTDIKFEVQAGTKPGKYAIKLVPGVGPVVTIPVVVK